MHCFFHFIFMHYRKPGKPLVSASAMSSPPLLEDKTLLHGVNVTHTRLGVGGYGSVFLGDWNGKRVAVKLLHPNAMGIDETGQPSKALDRFTKELPILQDLSHPSIVQVFGMVPPSSHQGSHGLVMEFLPVTLRNRYEQEPELTDSQEVSIMASVTSGLQYMHQKGILHRDLTTSNVMMVEKAGFETMPVGAKIIDVGIARVLADVNVDGATMSESHGAERYEAPEISKGTTSDGKARFTRPADIYSLGVTVMAMCNRREPPSLYRIVEKGREDDLALMAERRHPLLGVVSKCVQETLTARPTCSQLCEELAELQRASPTAAADGSQSSGGSATYGNPGSVVIQPSANRYQPAVDNNKLRAFNVGIIGDSNVGKTTVMLRFQNQGLGHDSNTTPTIGFGVVFKSMVIDDQTVTLKIWDTAGTERFNSISQNYVRRCDGIILMFDITDTSSFNNVSKWWTWVKKSGGGGATLMVIGNKKDLASSGSARRAVTEANGAALARTMDNTKYMETSGRSGLGVEEAFCQLVRAMLEKEDEETTQSGLHLHDHANNETLWTKIMSLC